jgi:hypothetical protein
MRPDLDGIFFAEKLLNEPKYDTIKGTVRPVESPLARSQNVLLTGQVWIQHFLETVLSEKKSACGTRTSRSTPKN